MKKFFSVIFLIPIAFICFGQQIDLEGKLVDKRSGDQIPGAHISSDKGHIAISDNLGMFIMNNFMIPTVLRITHISYGIIEYQVTESPKGLLVIQVEPSLNKIDEVQITGHRLRVLTQNEPFSVQQFEISDGVIWFIGHINNQLNKQRLFLANLYADTICSMPIRGAESLFKDVFNNVHLVLKDSVYQLFSPDHETIKLLYPAKKQRFYSIMSGIKASFNNKLVYSDQIRGQFGEVVYYIQKEDPVVYELTKMINSLDIHRARTDRRRAKIIRKQGIKELYNMWNTVRRYSKRGSKVNDVINYSVSCEVFSSGDNLYIINFLKDSLLQYDKDGQFKKATKIDFHKEERLGGVDYKDLTFLTDPVSDRVFLLERYIASWVLSPVNLNKGIIEPRIMLPDYPGMTSICVYNNAVYFHYHETIHPYYTRIFRYELNLQAPD